jgi:hypothetical protein
MIKILEQLFAVLRCSILNDIKLARSLFAELGRFDAISWVIPPERLKDRKTRTEPHRVPLSPQVVAILQALPRLGEFVFPGLKPGNPLSNMAMLSALKDMNCDESGF